MSTENTGTVIPGESNEQHANPNVAAERESAYETKAKELGWRPETEWEGDPSDWVDAKEFVGRQKLYDRIHSLKNDIVAQRKSFEQDMNVIKQYVQNMSEIEYKKAVADIKAQRKEAVKDANVEEVERLDTELEDLTKTRAAAPVQQTQTPSVIFQAWVDQNQWYATDSQLREDADSIGVAYALKHRATKTEQEVMDYVSAQIKRMYPEKFQTKSAPKAPAVEGTNAGGVRTAKGLVERDLTEDQVRVMNTLIKRIPGFTKEKYLKDLTEAQARG